MFVSGRVKKVVKQNDVSEAGNGTCKESLQAKCCVGGRKKMRPPLQRDMEPARDNGAREKGMGRREEPGRKRGV